jgi:hypothetical protein
LNIWFTLASLSGRHGRYPFREVDLGGTRFIPGRGKPREPAVRSYRLFNTALDFIFSGLNVSHIHVIDPGTEKRAAGFNLVMTLD